MAPSTLFISKDVFEILGRRGSKSSKSEITRIFRIFLIQQGSSGKFITRHEGRIKDTVIIKRTEPDQDDEMFQKDRLLEDSRIFSKIKFSRNLMK